MTDIPQSEPSPPPEPYPPPPPAEPYPPTELWLPPAAQRPGDAEPRGTTPAYGFPYPEPGDPLTQGAAAIRSLAEKDEAMFATIKKNWELVYVSIVEDGVYAWRPVYCYVYIDSMGGVWSSAQPTRLTPPEALGSGYFLAFANFFFTAASGTGGVSARLAIYNADTTLASVIAQANDGMNGQISLAGLWMRSANQYLQIEITAGATGTGHNCRGQMSLHNIQNYL